MRRPPALRGVGARILQGGGLPTRALLLLLLALLDSLLLLLLALLDSLLLLLLLLTLLDSLLLLLLDRIFTGRIVRIGAGTVALLLLLLLLALLDSLLLLLLLTLLGPLLLLYGLFLADLHPGQDGQLADFSGLFLDLRLLADQELNLLVLFSQILLKNMVIHESLDGVGQHTGGRGARRGSRYCH